MRRRDSPPHLTRPRFMGFMREILFRGILTLTLSRWERGLRASFGKAQLLSCRERWTRIPLHEPDPGRGIALRGPRPRNSRRNPCAAERGADGAAEFSPSGRGSG